MLRNFRSGLPSHAHVHLPFDSMWLSTQHGIVKDLRFLGKTWGSDTGRRTRSTKAGGCGVLLELIGLCRHTNIIEN